MATTTTTLNLINRPRTEDQNTPQPVNTCTMMDESCYMSNPDSMILQDCSIGDFIHGHVPAPSRLKSRRSFMTSTTPLETPSEARLEMWKEKLSDHPHSVAMHLTPPAESLPPGDNNWAECASIDSGQAWAVPGKR